MLKRLVGLLLVSALWGTATAQQPSPSVPRLTIRGDNSSLIPVPDVSVNVPTVLSGDVPDLATAPPVTIAAILRLANLGAYPFAEGFLALPNEPATEADLAFVFVNLFAPGVNGEFPVPVAFAAGYLQEQAGDGLVVDGTVTGEEALQALSAVLQLPPEAEAAVVQTLLSSFPAFEAGNLDIVLTRAALALFGSLALDAVQAQTPEG